MKRRARSDAPYPAGTPVIVPVPPDVCGMEGVGQFLPNQTPMRPRLPMVIGPSIAFGVGEKDDRAMAGQLLRVLCVDRIHPSPGLHWVLPSANSVESYWLRVDGFQ